MTSNYPICPICAEVGHTGCTETAYEKGRAEERKRCAEITRSIRQKHDWIDNKPIHAETFDMVEDVAQAIEKQDE